MTELGAPNRGGGTDELPPSRSVVATVLAAFRDPATTFLVVGGVVGILLVFLVPQFAGIDEAGHFVRSYQLSTGTMIPVDAPAGAPTGGGVCLPVSVAGELVRTQNTSALHALEGLKVTPKQLRAARAAARGSDEQLSARLPHCHNGEPFISVASFAWYSPLPYVPQAAAVAVVRVAGGGVDAMLIAGRLASVLAYVGIVWVAIRRSPVGRWALCITALLPVALFQGATSLSPDAMTTAIALLVISSALRMAADPSPRLPRAFLVEATVLGLALGLCKPSYAVLLLCYLLPLIGSARRLSFWPLTIPIGLSLGVSVIWQGSQAHLFYCDSRYFGVTLDPAQQRHEILTQPLGVVGAGWRALLDFGDKWVGDVITIGGRVVDWPVVFAFFLLAGFFLLAVQRAPAERWTLHWQQRVFLLVVFVVAYYATITGWLVYCEAPPLHIGLAPHARLFLPGLALLPLALEVPRGRLGGLSSARIPITVLLVPFEIVWLIALAGQIH
jgi:hypothetical protein